MTLFRFDSNPSLRRLLRASSIKSCAVVILLITLAGTPRTAFSQAPAAPPDVVVLSNGDTLHGKLVNATADNVNFHSDPLGDISIPWDKVKELHAAGEYAVLNKNTTYGRKNVASIPVGPLEVTNKEINVRTQTAPPAPIPVANTQYVMDKGTLDKQLYHHPGFFSGWNGAATAGASIVAATQNQYTVSGGLGLVRVVPTVTWLTPRNRTSIEFLGSYGKITDRSYTIPGNPPVFVPAVVTKTALYHADAERDEYFSPRFFGLVMIAFDHNYAQNLDLQQIYGGGLGWTVLKTPKQELDLKGTVQYERQAFISDSSANRNLIGSTVSADYVLRGKWVTYTQGLAYIPAFNDPHAYSATETNLLAFPAWKNFGFSVGTLDSYFNGPPASLPPTKRNSFQFTMGLTYAIKSKY
jgi:hypothetical protein